MPVFVVNCIICGYKDTLISHFVYDCVWIFNIVGSLLSVRKFDSVELRITWWCITIFLDQCVKPAVMSVCKICHCRYICILFVQAWRILEPWTQHGSTWAVVYFRSGSGASPRLSRKYGFFIMDFCGA
jgi:hypothetical protein